MASLFAATHGCRTMKGLDRRIGQRRDATRAPTQARSGWRPSGRLLDLSLWVPRIQQSANRRTPPLRKRIADPPPDGLICSFTKTEIHPPEEISYSTAG